MSAKADVMAQVERDHLDFYDDGHPTKELVGSVWSPPGKVFRASGCHMISFAFWTDRPAGWRWLASELAQGYDECRQPECEVCADG